MRWYDSAGGTYPVVVIMMHMSKFACRFRIMLLLCRIVANMCSLRDHSSVSLSKRCILKIMTNRPMVTMSSNAKLNQPSTMADVPTPDFMLPLPMS